MSVSRSNISQLLGTGVLSLGDVTNNSGTLNLSCHVKNSKTILMSKQDGSFVPKKIVEEFLSNKVKLTQSSQSFHFESSHFLQSLLECFLSYFNPRFTKVRYFFPYMPLKSSSWVLEWWKDKKFIKGNKHRKAIILADPDDGNEVTSRCCTIRLPFRVWLSGELLLPSWLHWSSCGIQWIGAATRSCINIWSLYFSKITLPWKVAAPIGCWIFATTLCSVTLT